MKPCHFPDIEGRLDVLTVDDPVQDGFALIRTTHSLRVQVAVAHDGSPGGRREAAKYACLIERSPELLGLLLDALDPWSEAFEGTDPVAEVSGADLVEWFGSWRERVKAALAPDA